MHAHKVPKHWNYFLAIEAELLSCTRYVEFSSQNFSCYSNEFAKLIVLAGAETDSIFAELCNHLSPASKAGNITQYRPILLEKYPLLTRCEITIDRYQLSLNPWKDWTEAYSPSWWRHSYNKLKHERSEHFHSASLEAALNAVAAQFLAILLYHHAFHGEYVQVDNSLASVLYSTKPSNSDFDQGGLILFYGDPFAHLS